jgi:hypothetical protein
MGGLFYLYSNMITQLDIFHERPEGDDNASTFMPAYQRDLSLKRPIAMKCMQVGVTDPGELDVNENLSRAGRLDGYLLVDKSCGGSGC